MNHFIIGSCLRSMYLYEGCFDCLIPRNSLTGVVSTAKRHLPLSIPEVSMFSTLPSTSNAKRKGVFYTSFSEKASE